MTSRKRDQHIERLPHQYFHIMLNIADDDLNPYEYRLLGHYMRVAGDNGACWESTRTTAKKCKMSVGKVVATRRELEEKKYITIETRPDETLNIRIVNLWSENIERYREKRSQDEQTVHVVNAPVHDMNQRRTNEQEPSIKDSAVAVINSESNKKPRARNEWYDAVYSIWGHVAGYNEDWVKMLKGIATKKQFKDYNIPAELGLTPEKLLAWAEEYYITNPNARDNKQLMLSMYGKVQSSIMNWLERQSNPNAEQPGAIKLNLVEADDSIYEGILT